jgi:L-2-hydroxyglutarate oxidase LhgO
MERVECVVVGAGVIGLAVARRLARAGCDVVVTEAAAGIGTGISSRNSEVIHGGMYYPSDSLRARLCVTGGRALYAYCAGRGIPHRRLGKLIVATDPAQEAGLAAIQRQGRINGVTDLVRLGTDEVRVLEPEVKCVAALFSPATGIVDSHALMLALRGDAESHGAVLAFNSPVLGGRVSDHGLSVTVGGTDPITLGCRMLVNAAGLSAQTVAAGFDGVPAATIPRQVLAKGSYFALTGGAAPFGRLVYPIPPEGGLGIHVTLDLGGQVRFGPDVEWTDHLDYRVDPRRAGSFYGAIRRYWPGLPDGALSPAYAGIRPKLSGPGQPAADFVIQGPADHGVPGLVNLYGIESPGLTASLAIADHVAELLVPDPDHRGAGPT